MQKFSSLEVIADGETITDVGIFNKDSKALSVKVLLGNRSGVYFTISSTSFQDLFEITKLNLEELPELLVHDNTLIRELAKYRFDNLK